MLGRDAEAAPGQVFERDAARNLAARSVCTRSGLKSCVDGSCAYIVKIWFVLMLTKYRGFVV